MLERWRDFLRTRRQCDPALQAEHFLAVAALHIGRALGMRDARGGHQVHRAGLDSWILPSLSRCMMLHRTDR